ncbi:uncharacterized protein FSUBG_11332 [Fusarium subglutinans]|uniref:Uncharacterized protein n=1 Tax=Gibberella subglutinans TaxID=42677 RepID=A0A8H5P3Z1_GIBSU|nr:uncharacterized protein FSUBG_11332 [Fusarium subglutinans]KAF5588879.1 hypothetical protein FSUBG_11332 [Fusarium subglutinans]
MPLPPRAPVGPLTSVHLGSGSFAFTRKSTDLNFQETHPPGSTQTTGHGAAGPQRHPLPYFLNPPKSKILRAAAHYDTVTEYTPSDSVWQQHLKLKLD